jgi:hypothetical protein
VSKKLITTGPRAARPWQKPARKIDDGVLTAFLFALEETGDVQMAADAAGASSGGIRRYADPSQPCYDPEFAEAWAESKARFIGHLKSETLRRATVGWEEPIIGGINRDQIVAKKKIYSDRLAELYLKRHDPKFRDKLTIESTKTINHLHGFDMKSLGTEERQMVRALLDAQKPKVIDITAEEVPDADRARNRDASGEPGSGAAGTGQS